MKTWGTEEINRNLHELDLGVIEDLVARRINPPDGLIWYLNIIAPRQNLQSRIAKAFLELCVK